MSQLSEHHDRAASIRIGEHLLQRIGMGILGECCEIGVAVHARRGPGAEAAGRRPNPLRSENQIAMHGQMSMMHTMMSQMPHK